MKRMTPVEKVVMFGMPVVMVLAVAVSIWVLLELLP